MWNGILSKSNITALEQTVEFAQRRHAILAGNVANMSTPGYKTRDLSVDDFQTNLKKAIDSEKQVEQSRLRPMESPTQQREAAIDAQQAQVKVRDAMSQIVYHDGSDDSIEQQVTEIAKNQSMHGMAVTLLRSQFATLNMAISESVNA